MMNQAFRRSSHTLRLTLRLCVRSSSSVQGSGTGDEPTKKSHRFVRRQRTDRYDRNPGIETPFSNPVTSMDLLRELIPRGFEVKLFDVIKDKPGYDCVKVSYNPLLEFDFDAIGVHFKRSPTAPKIPRTIDDMIHALTHEDPQKRLTPPLRDISERCRYFIQRSTDEANICRLMDTLIALWGNKATHFSVFDAFLDFVDRQMEFMTPQHLLQSLYYLGMTKGVAMNHSFVTRVEECVSQSVRSASFSLTEIGVMCASLHKLNHRIRDRRLLDYIHRQTVEGIHQLMDAAEKLSNTDVFPVVAMIKVLRHAKIKSRELNLAVTEFINKPPPPSVSSLVVLYHFAAVLANSFSLHTDSMKTLEKLAVFELENCHYDSDVLSLHPSERIRVKDVQGLLWIFATLNFPMEQKTVDIVVQFMMDAYFDRYEYMGQTYPLVDSLMSLAILGHYVPALADEIFTDEVVDSLKADNLVRHLNKLMLLEEAYNIEKKSWSRLVQDRMGGRAYLQRSIRSEIDFRKQFRAIFERLALRPPPGVEVTVKRSIRPIEISDIHVKTQDKGEFCIDVLDGSVCLSTLDRPTSLPQGLLAFKGRLLTTLGIQNFFLDPNEVDIADPEALWEAIFALRDMKYRCSANGGSTE